MGCPMGDHAVVRREDDDGWGQFVDIEAEAEWQDSAMVAQASSKFSWNKRLGLHEGDSPMWGHHADDNLASCENEEDEEEEEEEEDDDDDSDSDMEDGEYCEQIRGGNNVVQSSKKASLPQCRSLLSIPNKMYNKTTKRVGSRRRVHEVNPLPICQLNDKLKREEEEKRYLDACQEEQKPQGSPLSYQEKAAQLLVQLHPVASRDPEHARKLRAQFLGAPPAKQKLVVQSAVVAARKQNRNDLVAQLFA